MVPVFIPGGAGKRSISAPPPFLGPVIECGLWATLVPRSGFIQPAQNMPAKRDPNASLKSKVGKRPI